MSDGRKPAFRVGTGFDVHQFADGRRLILGGVEIPHTRGLAGHSDADALLHAITDAILGAVAEGDIGRHFPPSEERWRDCDSMVFLKAAADIARNKGYAVSNVDAVILAERPKVLPHVAAMRVRIASALGIAEDCVGVKATTMEKMGFVGREEGIAANAVALLERLG
jgi:2-C-methyl-D-erythritol 2,4-cyclodiphosphate synthase